MPVTPKSAVRGDKILQTAGKLFARQGYYGTSTREIARLADVSENTLFRHFKNKEELFWASLSSYSAGFKFRQDVLKGITQCDSPEVVLPKIIEMLADIVSYQPELLRLIAVAFVELNKKADEFCQEQLSPLFSAINHYLETNIRSGKIRDLDSTILTSALMMTVLAHPGIYKLIDGNKPVYSNSLEAHRAYTRFWMDLVVPRVSAYPLPIAQTRVESSG
ncbi:MAG: TetR/AcrR family transcriptional regulator [Terracidiphilus sp.]|nr:TetR/AcrR family transcriptional regulator [Terracidiphilus sp.]